MKVSIQLKKEEQKPQNQTQISSFFIRTKLPITIFNLPFLSSISVSTSSLSSPNLSLKTNFISGPSLKLSYLPNTNTNTNTNQNISPLSLSLSLSSGVSISGSPNNSPFIISAQFNLYPFGNNSPSPTFSLVFKPRFGDFGIKKSLFSRFKTDPDRVLGINQPGFVKEAGFEQIKTDPGRVLGIHEPGFVKDSVFSPLDKNPDRVFGNNEPGFVKESVFSGIKIDPGRVLGNNEPGFVKESVFSQIKTESDGKFGSGSDTMGFGPVDGHGLWKELNLGPTRERALGSGVSLWARTGIPVTKNVSVKLRWGVNFPGDFRKGLPFLSIDKIGIERVEEAVGERGVEKEKDAGKSVVDFEFLKEMCFSVGREVADLRRENREMKRCLDEILRKKDTGGKYSYNDGGLKVSKSMNKPVMASEDVGEIEGWNKVKKKGSNKEVKSDSSGANELEGELQRAIMAASASK